MIIYAVIETYQAYDSDGYNYWEEESIVDYFSTNKKAGDYIKEELDKRAILQKENHLINPHLDKKYFEDKADEILQNKILISVGTGEDGEVEEHQLLTVREITVK